MIYRSWRTKIFLNRWYVLRVAILADTLLENEYFVRSVTICNKARGKAFRLTDYQSQDTL